MLVTRFINQITARLPRKPAVYFFLTCIWWAVLFYLSGTNPAPKNAPDIPHLDKVVHFCYFLIGGLGLSATLALWRKKASRMMICLLTSIVISFLGAMDEYRQSFTEGRTGNDLGDWIADTLGGSFGALLFLFWILPKMLPLSIHRKDIKNPNSLDS